MKNKKLLLIFLITFLCLCGFMLLPFGAYFIVTPNQVTGTSMEPTFQDGDYILSSRVATPEIGDVVIYRSENFDKIGRIVAKGGDKIKIEDGIVYVNGKAEDPDVYEITTIKETLGATEVEDGKEYSVPADHFFILGDNRSNSKDSRFVGFISEKDVISVYMLTYKEAAN